jgi:hypothetical protein
MMTVEMLVALKVEMRERRRAGSKVYWKVGK